jgi:CRP/FNR family transcriptional regulator, cyclic AMP receptor protein
MLDLENLKLPLKFSEDAHRDFADGDLIFMEGDDSREMYVVLEGEVVVTKKTSKGGEIELARLHKGNFVGEMSLLESLPRSATARASGATRVLVIQPGGFLLKIRRDPTFAFEMLQTLSKRIRMTNDTLMNELGRAESSKESLRVIIAESEYKKDDPKEEKESA